MSLADYPLTAADQAEVDYGNDVIWRLVNSSIVAFGGNEAGEIYLSTMKDGVRGEFIIGKDEHGDITLFEVEKKETA